MKRKTAKKHVTFVEAYLAGECDEQAIDDYIDRWHSSSAGEALHEFLGMTWEEYSSWVEKASALSDILKARAR